MKEKSIPLETQREQYLAEKRQKAMVLPSLEFEMLYRRHFGCVVPFDSAVAFRSKDGAEGILINFDYYQRELREDFTDCIPYEIEHEAWELWLTRGEDNLFRLSPAHYEAIRRTLKKAFQDGKLGRYLDLRKQELQTFFRGDPVAVRAVRFYIDYAYALKSYQEYQEYQKRAVS